MGHDLPEVTGDRQSVVNAMAQYVVDNSRELLERLADE